MCHWQKAHSLIAQCLIEDLLRASPLWEDLVVECVEKYFPKFHVRPELQSAALFGSTVSTDSWVKWKWGPTGLGRVLNPVTVSLWEEDTETRTRRRGGTWRWGQRVGCCAHKPRTAEDRQGRQTLAFSPSAFPGSAVPPTPCFWTSGLQICARINSCCFKPPTLWRFVPMAPGQQPSGLAAGSPSFREQGCVVRRNREAQVGARGVFGGHGVQEEPCFSFCHWFSDLCHREAPWPCPRSGQPWVCGDQVSPRGKPLGQPCPPLPPSVSLLSSPSSKTDPTDLLEGFRLILETCLFHPREGRTVGTDRR